MSDVADHYHRDNLTETILNALAEAGVDPAKLTVDDLAPLDEFHIGGRQATRDMIELSGITPAEHVLDVGAGIGGPARTLAAACGCRVTGVDLTAEYCATATELTRRVGLADRVDFRQADACALPFEAAAFDVVWTQHMTMNVADKDRLYAELARVLRPGGRLVSYEVVAGPAGQAPHFPVPWADRESISFLESAADMRRRLEGSAARVMEWQDRSEAAQTFFTRLLERTRGEGAPKLGLQVIVGGGMKAKTQNLLRNLREGRVGVVLLLLTRS